MATFVATFLVTSIGFILFSMFAMFFENELMIIGICSWITVIGITIMLVIQHFFVDRDNKTVRELIDSWKEKYCKPIDFK